MKLTLAALAVTACGLAACGTAGTAPASNTPAPASTTPPVAAPTPNANAALAAAVQAYSADYLTGKGGAAYALLSQRCQQSIGLLQMTGLTQAAASLYGAIPIASLTVDSNNGTQATVTYTYAVAKLDQSQQPWLMEGGAWKDDNC